MSPVTRFDRAVHAGVASVAGFGALLVAGCWLSSGNLGLVVIGAAIGGLIAGFLGWRFGEKVLEWLSEMLSWTPY